MYIKSLEHFKVKSSQSFYFDLFYLLHGTCQFLNPACPPLCQPYLPTEFDFSMLLYVHRGRTGYYGRGTQDVHLGFYTAPELHAD